MNSLYKKITVGIIYSGRIISFKKLLKSIHSQNSEVNIFVYNNTNQKIKNHLNKFSKIKVYNSAELTSPSKARHVIINSCETDYLLLVDEDMILGKNCLYEFSKFLSENDEISVVGGLLKENYFYWPALYQFNISKTLTENCIWRVSYNYKPLLKKNIQSVFTDFLHPPFMINIKNKKFVNFDINYEWGTELFDFFYSNYVENNKTKTLLNVVNFHKPSKYKNYTKKTSRIINNKNGKLYFQKKWNIKIINNPFRLKDILLERTISYCIRILKKIIK